MESLRRIQVYSWLCVVAQVYIVPKIHFQKVLITNSLTFPSKGQQENTAKVFYEAIFLNKLFGEFPCTFIGEMKWLSRVRPFTTSWTVAYQAPLSMGFSRQEYWSGLPFPSLIIISGSI